MALLKFEVLARPKRVSGQLNNGTLVVDVRVRIWYQDRLLGGGEHVYRVAIVATALPAAKAELLQKLCVIATACRDAQIAADTPPAEVNADEFMTGYIDASSPNALVVEPYPVAAIP